MQITPCWIKKRFLRGKIKPYSFYVQSTNIYTVPKYTYSVSVVLRFHRAAIRKKCLKSLLWRGA